MNKFKSYKVTSKKHKIKWRKIFLRIVFIIILLITAAFLVFLYYYLKPEETIEYYRDESSNYTNQIKFKGTKCYTIPPLSNFKNRFEYRRCGENTSYYLNGQIQKNKRYYKNNGEDYYEYSSYYKNGQKKIECNFKMTTIELKSGDGVYQYESSVEPCVFYDEDGQIQREYGEGKIEKDYHLHMTPKAGYYPGFPTYVESITFYDEAGKMEKTEFYEKGTLFLLWLIERDIKTPDGITKEHYFWDGDLSLIEYYDNEGKLVSERLYETRKFDKGGDLESKTFYNEDDSIEKIEKYIYDGEKLIRMEEYDNEGYITHIERYKSN